MVDSSSYDGLTSALSQVRLRGSIFAASELRAPWGVRSEGLGQLVCFTCLEGEALLVVRGKSQWLAAGDVVMVRAGVALELKASAKSATVPFERFAAKALQKPRVKRSGATTKIVCGSLWLDPMGQQLFATALPPFVRIPRTGASLATRSIVEALAAEVTQPGPGSALVLTRLAELLFLQIMRACIDDEVRGTSGWLRGVAEPSLAPVLAAIHTNPGAPWSVESLAGRAAMSRSVFARTFHRIIGQTPLAYVTAWRMRRAAQLLEDPGTTVKAVAAKVGYGSDEAFSRAFRAWAGQPPGRHRLTVRPHSNGTMNELS